MKVAEIPEGASFYDVEGIPVARLPDSSCIAFDRQGNSRPYPNERKVAHEGDPLNRVEFGAYVLTGISPFAPSEGGDVD